jgi:release factor glutamine methyltransferase
VPTNPNFELQTVGSALGQISELLAEFSDAPRLEAELLVAKALGKERAAILAASETRLSASQAHQLAQDVTQRLKRKPLQQILGSKLFWDKQIEISDQVLIPRQDTEMLVEYISDYASKSWKARDEKLEVLEIGVGSGALLVALVQILTEMGLRSTPNFWGCDINPEAVRITQKNLGRIFGHDLGANLLESDLFEEIPANQKFDLIVSNPPYLPESASATWQAELNYEPKIALVSGSDGLELYRRLIEQLPGRLKPEGRFWGEHLPAQVPALKELAKQNGAKVINFHPALDGQIRFIELAF